MLIKIHYTTYECEGKMYFCIWKSFFSKCFDVVTFEIS